MTERDYYLAFSLANGVGPKTFSSLLRHFKTAKKAWNVPISSLKPILKPALTEKFERFRKEFDFDNFAKQIKKQKIDFVALCDSDYPDLLKQIPNAPIVLFIKGNKKLLQSSMVSIVGTRRITNYGREITEMFARQLSLSGLTIVSGMAFGVDGVAHEATIEANGKTIAVLGNGVDLAYPKENEKLYEEILDSGGAIISEYPPGSTPTAGSFPARNRIVAGLCSGVLVTEGAQDSGSLITANYGLEFGRKVFAVPGPITSSLSAAPLKLIEKGAKLVVTPEDVIRELGIKPSDLPSNKKQFSGLSSEEKKIVELIENESLHFDEIARRLKIDTSKLGTLLSLMEVKGLLKSFGGNYSLHT